MPVVEPGVPSDRWALGADGRAAARALRASVPDDAYLVASTEIKAVQTLAEMSGRDDVLADPGFAEVRRPGVWSSSGGDYRALARTYVEGQDHDGWESRDKVAARFEAAVSRHQAAAAGRPLFIGTHGLALTTWLAGRMPIEAGEFWAGLQFPDLIEVDI
jgi:broad specificity phosphatase PhoE